MKGEQMIILHSFVICNILSFIILEFTSLNVHIWPVLCERISHTINKNKVFNLKSKNIISEAVWRIRII